MNRLGSWLAVGVGLVVAIAGIAWSMAQAGSGVQPWDAELSDILVFARSLPLIIGFGVLTGFGRALFTAGEPSDGRMAPSGGSTPPRS